ncbi:hypothetical protein OSC27_12160 [Microbacterium sp. STN6]|uniref:phenylacetate--CoA ligase family protein n=1 Tax=Microbacterium sp. STN6 TaxID=2995588 RepID=UPI002260D21A|nr:hypothetical protein [Microbacterium sp. STN6]MCX7523028.1 hypothetical protein [Microbacterium sp. STN6]
MSAADLSAVKDAHSIAIARFAMKHSPFYAEFYRDHGFSLNDLEDPSAFYELPLLTKEMIREHADEIRSDESTERNSVTSMSSGSTGEPLKVLRDLRVHARAYEWRLQRWWGIEPWANTATIDRHYRTASARRKQALLWWPSTRIQLDTFDISDEALEAFASAWKRTRPEFLIGYVGGVVALARLARVKGIEFESPRAIGVTAGPLPESQRAEIEDFFGAPAFDHYRSSEANWMAGECDRQSGLHTFDDIKNVEIVRDGVHLMDESEGEVVITDFENKVFPLVRYQLGDLSSRILAPCACGRPHSRISPVRGRTSDFLVLPSGKVILGGLTGLYAGANEYVRQFQLHQQADYSIIVRCLLTEHPDAVEVAEKRLAALRANVDGEVPVSLEIVDEIRPTRGKFRFIMSDAPKTTATTQR